VRRRGWGGVACAAWEDARRGGFEPRGGCCASPRDQPPISRFSSQMKTMRESMPRGVARRRDAVPSTPLRPCAYIVLGSWGARNGGRARRAPRRPGGGGGAGPRLPPSATVPPRSSLQRSPPSQPHGRPVPGGQAEGVQTHTLGGPPAQAGPGPGHPVRPVDAGAVDQQAGRQLGARLVC
jgi:hypothetical protein